MHTYTAGVGDQTDGEQDGTKESPRQELVDCWASTQAIPQILIFLPFLLRALVRQRISCIFPSLLVGSHYEHKMFSVQSIHFLLISYIEASLEHQMLIRMARPVC